MTTSGPSRTNPFFSNDTPQTELQAVEEPLSWQIRAYHHGGFTINHKRFHGALLVFSDAPPQAWPVNATLQTEDFDHLAALRRGILLIGSGAHQKSYPPENLAALYEAMVGFEVMNTAAACRTFNLLSAEGRLVTAALLPV